MLDFTNQKTEHFIWCEKYRPKDMENYIGNDHILSKVDRYLKSGEIPHILLYGPAGTGKCLDYSEKITVKIELTDEEYEKLKKYLKKK